MKVTVELSDLMDAINSAENERKQSDTDYKTLNDRLCKLFGLTGDLSFAENLTYLDDHIRAAHRHLMDVNLSTVGPPKNSAAIDEIRRAIQSLEAILPRSVSMTGRG